MKTIFNTTFKRLFITLFVATISISVLLVSAKDKTGIMNKNYNNNKDIVPYAPAFNMDTLLKWTPESDPDAEYARSTIPLKTGRFYGPQVNEKATKGVKIQTCSILKSGRDAQEQNTFSNYVFTHWQYLDSVAGWGIGDGSNVGILGVPSADQIDAAHRNGVPITGLFGFPWSYSDYGVSEFKKLVSKQGETYPYFDKLAQIANYYGFDGYFINQETSGLTTSDGNHLREAIYYARKKYPNLIFQWYDAMRWDNAAISGQNGIGSGNRGWVEYNQELAKQGVAKPYAVDDVFINYSWGNVPEDQANMEAYGRNKYDALFTFEVQANGVNSSDMTKMKQLVEANDGKAKASIGYYCIDSNFGLANSVDEFHKNENKFWSTSTEDPRVEPNRAGGYGANFAGMARFVYDKSVINETPFNTFFNTGHGKAFYIDGQKMHSRQWTNRSLQDITPTWNWLIDSEDNVPKLKAAYDFETAFYGGNSIKYTGNLTADKAQFLKLYSTRIDQDGNTQVRFAYKEQNDMNKTALDLLVARGIKNSIKDYVWEEIPFNVETEKNGWKIATCTIPQGEIITGLGIKVKGASDLNNYQLNIGQLSLLGDIEEIGKVSNITIPNLKLTSQTEGSLRTRFDQLDGALYYEVYSIDNDGTKRLLTVNTNNAIYCNYINHLLSDGKVAKIGIVPVDKNGVRHEDKISEQTFYWETMEQTNKADQTSQNLCLNDDPANPRVMVTNISSENGAEKGTNMFDGSSGSNSSKWCATTSSGYCDIKFTGGEKTVRRIRIEHAEAGGEDPAMNTIDFEVLYKDKLSNNWVSTGYTYSYNTKGITDAVLPNAITAEEFRLKINNCGGTPWRAIRIYEWQMFENGFLPLTPNYDASQIEVTRKAGGLADIKFNNPQKEATYFIRQAMDFTSPTIASGTATSNAPVELKNVNIGEGEVDFFYSVKYDQHEESNIIKYHLLAEDAQVSNNFNDSDLIFKQSKKSNHYARIDDLQFIDITFKSLKKGEQITIKQNAPYSKVFVITAYEDNQEITVKGVCISKTDKKVKIDRAEANKKATGEIEYTVVLS